MLQHLLAARCSCSTLPCRSPAATISSPCRETPVAWYPLQKASGNLCGCWPYRLPAATMSYRGPIAAHVRALHQRLLAPVGCPQLPRALPGNLQRSAAAPVGVLIGRGGAPCRSPAGTLSSPAMSLHADSPSLSLSLQNQGVATELPERPSEAGEGTFEVPAGAAPARQRSAENLGSSPSSILRPPAAPVTRRSVGSRDAVPAPPTATSARPAGASGGGSSHGSSRQASPFADVALAAQSALGSSKTLPGPLRTPPYGSIAAVDSTGLTPEEMPALQQSPSLPQPGAPQALQAWPSKAVRQPQGTTRIASSFGRFPSQVRRQPGHEPRVSLNGALGAAPVTAGASHAAAWVVTLPPTWLSSIM